MIQLSEKLIFKMAAARFFRTFRKTVVALYKSRGEKLSAPYYLLCLTPTVSWAIKTMEAEKWPFTKGGLILNTKWAVGNWLNADDDVVRDVHRFFYNYDKDNPGYDKLIPISRCSPFGEAALINRKRLVDGYLKTNSFISKRDTTLASKTNRVVENNAKVDKVFIETVSLNTYKPNLNDVCGNCGSVLLKNSPESTGYCAICDIK